MSEASSNIYAYVSGNPVSKVDPLGLKDYSVCETKELMDLAKEAAVSGSVSERTNAVLSNHSSLGRNGPDIGILDIRKLDQALATHILMVAER